MSEILDVIVIGGGLVGSSAAWRLAARGRSVVQLEQFGPGHKHGASHGTSRIYRQAYDNHRYTGLAADALPLWRELETTTDIGFLELTGAVDHGLPQAVQSKAKILLEAGIKGEILTPAEASARWPGLRFDTTVLHHPRRRPVARGPRRDRSEGGSGVRRCRGPSRCSGVGTRASVLRRGRGDGQRDARSSSGRDRGRCVDCGPDRRQRSRLRDRIADTAHDTGTTSTLRTARSRSRVAEFRSPHRAQNWRPRGSTGLVPRTGSRSANTRPGRW